jgi:hypothetical protein
MTCWKRGFEEVGVEIERVRDLWFEEQSMIRKLHVICKLKRIRRGVKGEKRVFLGLVWSVGLRCMKCRLSRVGVGWLSISTNERTDSTN